MGGQIPWRMKGIGSRSRAEATLSVQLRDKWEEEYEAGKTSRAN